MKSNDIIKPQCGLCAIRPGGGLPSLISHAIHPSDSRSMVKLQNIFHEYERTIQKSKSRHGHQTGKVSQLEMERAELKSTLDEVKEIKSALERQQLELQTELNNLK